MERLLIVGFGDVARRALPALRRRFEVVALSRAAGFDLDRPAACSTLPPAHSVLHCVPPQSQGESDTRTAHLLSALDEANILPVRMVYVSTSGVYGDCGGALVDETRPIAPRTARAKRRADAERRLQGWCTERGVALVVLRAPGIYAAQRLPLERLRAGTPVLRPEDDVYTNHIHADDLASIAVRALEPDAPAGVYNASDDTQLKMAEWFDLLADRAALPRPPRVARVEAAGRIPAALLEFMTESRRLDNRRLKERLGVRLRYPTVHEGVPALLEAA